MLKMELKLDIFCVICQDLEEEGEIDLLEGWIDSLVLSLVAWLYYV